MLLAFIALHVAAILFYRLRGKSLLKPMITGKGEAEPGVEPMRPGKGWVALLCLVVAIGDHPLDHRRSAAVRGLIAAPRGTTSRPC